MMWGYKVWEKSMMGKSTVVLVKKGAKLGGIEF